MRELTLYHTLGCHLCELAHALVEPVAAARGWRVVLVDIADDDGLHQRYGTRIPVLYDAATGAELGWPFDAQAVIARFD